MNRLKKVNPELGGFAAASVGSGCIAWHFAGPLMAVGVALVVLGAVLVLIGNA